MPFIRAFTGMTDGAARGFIGQLRKTVREDCAGLLAIFAECEDAKPAEPKAWLMAAAQKRAGTHRKPSPMDEQRENLRRILRQDDASDHPSLLAIQHHGGVQ